MSLPPPTGQRFDPQYNYWCQIENPDNYMDEYHARCCRFPKSCSAWECNPLPQNPTESDVSA